MRYIALLMFLMIPTLSLANEVKCYNAHGRLIYNHAVHDVSYVDDVLVFVENKSNMVILTTTDCIVRINK